MAQAPSSRGQWRDSSTTTSAVDRTWTERSKTAVSGRERRNQNRIGTIAHPASSGTRQPQSAICWLLRIAVSNTPIARETPLDGGSKLVEFEPTKRLAIRWRNEWLPEAKEEGWSLCTMEIEPAAGESVKLTVTHAIDGEGSKLINAVSGGWPQILSNLKSLLETGATILPPKYLD